MQAQPITCVVTAAGSTATLTFSRPVNVAGTIPLTVATRTLVTQTIVSPTVVTMLMSGALTTLAYSLPTPITNVSSYEGGVALGAAGTFP